MGRIFELDPLGPDGSTLYGNPTFEFEPGVTCLVGCNGAGKTTLMADIQYELKALDIPYARHYVHEAKQKLSYMASVSGGSAFMDYAGSVFASEGEGISRRFQILLRDVGHFVLSECSGKEECWVFFDSLDSGLSADMMQEIVEFLQDMVGEMRPPNLDIYAVMAVNSFEFARAFDCLDVQTAKHLRFDDYDDYVSFVKKSRERKEKRLEERS